MSCEIVTSPTFEKSVKRLAKRYKSLGQDLIKLVEALKENPYLGVDLGRDVRKVRMTIASKGKGKSGGARVITYKFFETEGGVGLLLLDIYDKSDQETVKDNRIDELLRLSGF